MSTVGVSASVRRGVQEVRGCVGTEAGRLREFPGGGGGMLSRYRMSGEGGLGGVATPV